MYTTTTENSEMLFFVTSFVLECAFYTGLWIVRKSTTSAYYYLTSKLTAANISKIKPDKITLNKTEFHRLEDKLEQQQKQHKELLDKVNKLLQNSEEKSSIISDYLDKKTQ